MNVLKPSLIAVLVAVSLVLLSSGDSSPVQATHGNLNIHVHEIYFHPEDAFGAPTDHGAAQQACQAASPDPACDAQIHVGDTITWVSAAPLPAQIDHTVTECTDAFGTCGPNVDPNNPIGDTGMTPPNGWPSAAIQFTAAGTYYYQCDLHGPLMRGRVVVSQPATPTPTASPTPAGSSTPTSTPAATQAGAAASVSARASGSAAATVAAALFVPGGGGPPGGGVTVPWYAFMFGGGLVLIASAGLSLRAMHQR